RLKALQYVFPRAVGAAQYQLSNEPNSFGCAAQYDRRARTDAQLWIDWEVRHGQLTPGCGRGSIRRGNEIVRGNSFRTAQSARKLLPFSSSKGSVLIFILLRRVRDVRVLSLLVEPYSTILSGASICRARSCRGDRCMRKARGWRRHG